MMKYLFYTPGLCLFLTLPFPAQANNYLDSLIQQSRTMNLAQQVYWYKLLHYNRNKFSSGVTSQADDAKFFIAPNGKTNPQAELEATLAQFFIPAKKNITESPLQCRFPARYQWLKTKLAFDSQNLPEQSCPKLNEWLKTLDVNSLTLVFPSAYIDNPSTMFGHTFLRLNKSQSSHGTALTSAAINYAAEKTEFSGPLFAIESLTGGQSGYFSLRPYYEKVNEYSDLESRDIWEYDLTFTPAEIRRMLLHLWELQKIRFDYYFLDENCSYQLLALLDLSRTDLNLRTQFPYDVIPIDTVRTILQIPTIMKRVHYRPSARTTLSYELDLLTESERQLVRDLAYGRLSPYDQKLAKWPDSRKALLLNTAYEYVQFKYRRRKISREDSAPRSLQLLSARSSLSGTYAPPSVPEPGVRPDQGHPSARLIFSLGRFHRNNFLELGWRPAYHDLLDSNDGHVAGSQINFLDTRLRIDSDTKKLSLQKLTLIDIYSVTPYSQDFNTLSWKFNTGLERLPLTYSSEDKLPYTVNAGAGRTWAVNHDLRIFAMLEGTLMLHKSLDNYFSAGAGPSLGVLWKLNRHWKLWLNGRMQRYGINLNRTYLDYSLNQSFILSRDLALRLHMKRSGIENNLHNEISVNIHFYY
ncbi:MAG TPA: DUF4105 domain-containing protein [Gammaproteobacteria bacterium]|nr:DUF4105 domain-containing protein [Gammaproteobacteria bacterium]